MKECALMLLILFIVGCKKSNNKLSISDQLMKHTWYYDTVVISEKYAPDYTDCRANCYIEFSNNGKAYTHYENSPCGIDTFYTQVVNYRLDNDPQYSNPNVLVINNINPFIKNVGNEPFSLEITDSTLKLSSMVVGQPLYYYKFKVRK